MGSGDRLLVFLTSLFLIAVALFLGSAAGQVPAVLPVASNLLATYVFGRWEAAAVALLVLVLALRLAYLAWPWRREGQFLVQNSELGEVSIALTAIENLVQRAAAQVEGVKDVRSRVRARPEGVSVSLKAWVGSEVNVPTLGARLQETVRRRLEEVVGLKAAAIRVAVKDIGGEQRFKVR